jgi:RimJ/RimL family protein N-acetyltransferase
MTGTHKTSNDRTLGHRVQLVPMTEQGFARYLERAVETYAEEKSRAGNWHPSEALEKAEGDFHALLPDGVATTGQHLFILELFTLEAGGTPIGMIWFAEAPSGGRQTAFIYNFWIEEGERSKGYGRAALEAFEDKVTELGLQEISLHVFAHNHAAIAIYERAGYMVTNLNMSKTLL